MNRSAGPGCESATAQPAGNGAGADIAPNQRSVQAAHASRPRKNPVVPGHRRSPRLIRVVAAVAISILLAAGVVDAATSAPSAPDITESRNAAAGFAITLWMVNVDALGDHCRRVGGPSDAQFLSVLDAWQGRNMPYVNAALEYVADTEDFIKATQGEPARKQFHADRKDEFVTSTRKVEVIWFPDGKFDEASCLKLASRVAEGVLDLDREAEFFQILQAMKMEVDSRDARR